MQLRFQILFSALDTDIVKMFGQASGAQVSSVDSFLSDKGTSILFSIGHIHTL